MKVTVLITTYDREELLRKCIKSIKDSYYEDISIFVIVDGNKALYHKLLSENMPMLFNEERMDYVYAMNRALRHMEITDAILYASDDLEFAPDCISKAVQMLQENFPDGDGLIGLNQQNRRYGSKSAFGLVGKKFINRFPDCQMFCPKYVHYGSDTELGNYARSLGRFRFCEEAMLLHFIVKDETDRLVRPVRKIDEALRESRESKGLIWGKKFE